MKALQHNLCNPIADRENGVHAIEGLAAAACLQLRFDAVTGVEATQYAAGNRARGRLFKTPS
ncbi:MAG: hypothetical protein AAGC60_28395 [Acidobacteriota bacterium]